MHLFFLMIYCLSLCLPLNFSENKDLDSHVHCYTLELRLASHGHLVKNILNESINIPMKLMIIYTNNIIKRANSFCG